MAGVNDEGRSGLSRRQMIKASAVAGAAAWTAPMIIDSLSSPAAAGTAVCQNWYQDIADSTNTFGQGNNGPCTPQASPFQGHTLNTSPPFHPILICGAGTSAGICSVTLPAGCDGQILYVKVHYGTGGVDGTCVTSNCFQIPFTACNATPPTSVCGGCKSGDTVYFQQMGRSGVEVIWCC